MTLILIFILALLRPTVVAAQSTADFEHLFKIQTPVIENGVLFISGPITSHIYDFIAYEYRKMAEVHTVSLNSLGGNSDWAMSIGEKIQDLGLNTRVEQGHYCASACIYLFGSGSQRVAHQSVWFGLHGARLGPGAFNHMASSCGGTADTTQLLAASASDCQASLDKWYTLAKDATDRSFALIEQAGVSPELRTTYYSLDTDPLWFERGNALRIKDFSIDANAAKGFNLVTDVITH